MALNVASLGAAEIASCLNADGLNVSIGCFGVNIRSSLPQIQHGLSRLYGDFPLLSAEDFIDFRVAINTPPSIRRWFRPQVTFEFDGFTPFKPLPIDQAFALFEWGLNWVVANHCHQFAIVHSAVVEKNGHAFIFPGSPGSGKSTLCAALACNGWRLLSDEMALISLENGQVQPFPRPISLKNQSIEIIRDFYPSGIFGQIAHDTAKGSVSHLKAPTASIKSSHITAKPFAVIFPKYDADSSLEIESLTKGNTMMQLAENCFNYPVIGREGFECLADVSETCIGRKIRYSTLDQAFQALELILTDA